MQLSFVVPAVVLFAGALVHAEQHTIKFDNRCGKGTPQLLQNGKVLSSGEPFTSNGPFSAGIAYVKCSIPCQCLYNGENCSLLEMTLVNPTAPGAGSSTDISLIAPHAFNVPVSFSYFGGCDGQGATCSSGTCKTAFFQPDDNQVQVQCQENNVNLLITFCGDATSATESSGGSKPAPSSIIASHSTAAAHTSAASHAASSTHVAPSVTVSSAASLAVQSTSAAPAAASSAAASAPSCKAGSRRRRRSASPEADTTSPNKIRRHHAR
ncbi:hypothetical protein OH77DRAFT_1382408, partial [Trametes cingulata]